MSDDHVRTLDRSQLEVLIADIERRLDEAEEDERRSAKNATSYIQQTIVNGCGE